MRHRALLPITIALALALAAAVAPAGAATSAQSSIRFAWSQQITYAGVGDARACRYMNEAYQRQFMNGAPITARDCPAAVKAIYLRERKNLGSAKLARQTRADAAAAKRTRITVTGSSARAKLKATTGDCIRTQNQRFTRTNGRWLVGDITANTASLSCFGR